jgi:hypothetical protein
VSDRPRTTGEQRRLDLDDEGRVRGVVIDEIDPALEESKALCGLDPALCAARGHLHREAESFPEAVVGAALDNARDKMTLRGRVAAWWRRRQGG